jgi:hypothetical protein
VVGLGSLAVVLVLRRVAPVVPAPLVAVLAGIIAVHAFGLERHGVEIVGHITGGLPSWIGSGIVHGTLNLSQAPARFQVVGQPGAMTGYFAQAGVRVADPRTEPATAPPDPGELHEIATRWGITFWTGPVSTSEAR